MAKMTGEEREKFLAELHVGVIAVERPDRAPLSVPIWYGYEPGGEVLIWTEQGSVKEKLIRAAGRFSLTAQVEQPPYRYVTAEGPVTTIEPATPDMVRPIAIRYLGEAEGTAFTEQNYGTGSLLIRMRPERWLSTDYTKE
ncbi:pyridoxamine 5'-phosphate oxidase family protein [Nocardia terpenica]|nr:pyridoxamine 5'-phosphate oxidase family protein [Nocardia terpenica]MBF6064785.1 pyridoxamine 5'-phosphate oxidase family protein [Nocardia terpenica]MBF6107300.1 pyridoxamine 5'-phosphate oxidase family protein [Nocardia terpenica]MBF6115057.1 pyridoxamine 5'-phosphate oxidase family protein [Nocardia terpenica]MBF6122163.1 pyridoxamine 5'-phosphate oxidase family protein [Nocardia terpenica]MBF6154546.1 pyridoxamine 5'-phosphate oxidase family protein [Nocardia terpenica]